ncbi:MAG: cellulose binding domain-containing protein, partial [Acidobacteriota bacterium]
ASQSALDGHVADFNNPHQVTAAQTGAATQSALDGHVADFNNPHQVTAAQVGADPAGTAAAAVAALEASLNDGLPVPVAEGGTGATDAATARANLGIEEDQSQTGIVSAAAFQGSPATASVTFASPYAVGTTYAVLLTAISSDPSNLVTANVIALDETGFTVAVSDTGSLSAVSWMARPAVVASAVAITSPADGSSFMPSESFDVDYVLASAVGVRAYLDGVAQLEQFGAGPITLTAPATEGTFELRLEALDANGVELGVSDAIQIEVAAQTSAISCTVVNPNVWNNGYVLNYTVTNEGSETIDAWSVALQFTEQANFGNSWNAQLTLSSDGTVIEASNASYNGTLAPGQSASFGFQGSHDGTFDVPTCTGN